MENKALNPMNIIRNSFGRRRIFINMPPTPAGQDPKPIMVYLNSDLSGDAVNVKIMHTQVDAVTPQPFYQIEFGEGSVHTQVNIAVNAKPSCFQILGNGSREKVPIRFNSDHLPQNFRLCLYDPGEMTVPTRIGPRGAQFWIEYDYIAN
jgi:hypothetical protein